jgi:hypothetical protein
MYIAALQSLVSPDKGTAGLIRRTLEEMQAEGLAIDSRVCHVALEALAVHPDYILRTQLLEYMREKWYTLSPSGANYVVAGLLRERQFELALERMEGMERENVPVFAWTRDLAMWLLLRDGEVEEAFRIALGRERMSQPLWAALLDAAARGHYVGPPSTLYV